MTDALPRENELDRRKSGEIDVFLNSLGPQWERGRVQTQ